ncbi:MAG: trypsin-like peptidase domain-containing protein [Bacteriovoracaceae bacterium]|nr:trypsin-like peptidase domain-containing protein [Bacteriovoracaceae bacterium]
MSKVNNFALIVMVFSLGIFSTLAFKSKEPLNEEYDYLTANEKNTIDVFQKSVNSVVNVTNIKMVRSGWDYDIYGVRAGVGTGFVWDDLGHIVTNFHVVAGGDSFLISFLKDKNQYQAKIVGIQPHKDIAVLKLVKKPKKLYPITVGKSKNLLAGQKAIAIGNPFEMEHTVTQGIISALDRKIEGVSGIKIHGMIQTDASINPGNSGGPLLNSRGKLIGMNTQILSRSGGSSGVGFAVPVDPISRIVPQLIKHGKVIQPGLGISIPRNSRMEEGIEILAVASDGPAALAGLRGRRWDRHGRRVAGDIMLEINGTTIHSYDDVYNILERHQIGDVVEITAIQDGVKKKIKVKLSAIF